MDTSDKGPVTSESLDKKNYTMVTYFIIKGISDVPEVQVLIFLLVLLIYLTTLGGNMTIFLLVCLDTHLHTPMYFFLGNLSILDMTSTTIALHMVLASFISRDNTVSRPRCLGQMFMFSSVAIDEFFLSTTMSYDRYVAICNPLRYHMVMNPRICGLLAIICWLLGFIAMAPFLVVMSNSCYRSNVINHFFCDFVPLSTIICSDTFTLRVLIDTISLCGVIIIPSLFTFISYAFIIDNILKIRTSTGRRKAFYTCSSQLTVVILFYVIITYQYIKPANANSLNYSKLLSLFNTVAVPLLNPLIYSLKNKDVKSALNRLFRSLKCKY